MTNYDNKQKNMMIIAIIVIILLIVSSTFAYWNQNYNTTEPFDYWLYYYKNNDWPYRNGLYYYWPKREVYGRCRRCKH